MPPPLRGMHGLPAHQRQAPAPHLQLVRKVWRCGGRESRPKKVKWTCARCRLQIRACVSGGIRPAAEVEKEPAGLGSLTFRRICTLLHFYFYKNGVTAQSQKHAPM